MHFSFYSQWWSNQSMVLFLSQTTGTEHLLNPLFQENWQYYQHQYCQQDSLDKNSWYSQRSRWNLEVTLKHLHASLRFCLMPDKIVFLLHLWITLANLLKVLMRCTNTYCLTLPLTALQDQPHFLIKDCLPKEYLQSCFLRNWFFKRLIYFKEWLC